MLTTGDEATGPFGFAAVWRRASNRRSLRRADWKLILGIVLIAVLLLFGLAGRLFISERGLRLGAGGFAQPPSLKHPFGTDNAGRDLLALMIYGTAPTLRIGLIAGGVGTAIGVILGMVTGYYRGPLDTIIRTVGDIMLAVPTLLVLVVIASYVKNTNVETMSFIIASFAWPWPARAIRSQTLSLRERAFVDMAKLSGRSDIEIIFKDLMPNLLPYIAAGFVGGVSGGILSAVGLQLLGLGPTRVPTLGLILHNSFQSAAIFRGLWWWWLPPTLLLAMLFIGLFLISLSLDEIANPRLKGMAG